MFAYLLHWEIPGSLARFFQGGFFTTFTKSPRLFEVFYKFLIYFEKLTTIFYSTVLSYTDHYSDLEVNSVYTVVVFTTIQGFKCFVFINCLLLGKLFGDLPYYI